PNFILNDNEYSLIRAWYSLKNNTFIVNLDQKSISNRKNFYTKSIVANYNENQFYYDYSDKKLYFTKNNSDLKPFFTNENLKISNFIFNEENSTLTLKEFSTNHVFILDLKINKIVCVLLDITSPIEESSYLEIYKKFITKYDANFLDNPIHIALSPSNDEFNLYLNKESGKLTFYTESNIDNNLLPKIYHNELPNLDFYNYDKNLQKLFLTNSNESHKLLSSNVTTSQPYKDTIFSNLNNGSWVLFKTNSNPVLIGLDIKSDNKKQILSKIEETKNLVPNMQLNSKITLNYSNYCYFPRKNEDQGRIQICD
ncbi:MAG: hypothetical protein K2X69_07915, partial [Silvanigrellaceae bacterium]|nr:hypothetical protein [Silvanigrellaceae bacterium]